LRAILLFLFESSLFFWSRTMHPLSGDRKSQVALVQMPFGVTSWPSLSLSLLKSQLIERGFQTKVFYLNKEFRNVIGESLYSKIARGAPQNVDLFGEWIFSHQLWGESREADEEFKRLIISGAHPAHEKDGAHEVIDEFLTNSDNLKARASNFISDCVNMDWQAYGVVGFTSTFQQHVPSLALAKALKDRWPRLHIVLGGANCEAKMGIATLRNFSFIDAVCVGEGDNSFPDYVEAIDSGCDLPEIDCIVTRGRVSDDWRPDKTRPFTALETLPFPNFDDFFADAPKGDSEYQNKHRLVFETSRGCWWGQKHHCTFCGLNGSSLSFRQKSGERALRELKYLLARYGDYTRHVTATDNILPYTYFRSFLPELAKLSMDISLFYETKANLKRDQLELYRAAGLTSIQPGIESLSTPVLKLMRKGVSALQNIQILKWCKELGIDVKWNFLAGFPGEEASWYAGLPSLIRSIRHLAAPIGVSTLRYDRFSPYHTSPDVFGLPRLIPYPSYRLIYRGLEPKQIEDLAYYFIPDNNFKQTPPTYAKDAFAELTTWKEEQKQFALFHAIAGTDIVVFDVRSDSPRVLCLKGNYAKGLAAASQIVSISEFERQVGRWADQILEDLLNFSLIALDGGNLLSVSLSIGDAYSPPSGAIDRLSTVLVRNEKGGIGTESIIISSEHTHILDCHA